MTDAQLKAHFEDIFDAYNKEILRYAGFKMTDRYMAEDIAASTFLRYWEKITAGEKIANPRAFLYSIAHGFIIDQYRKASRHAAQPIAIVDDIFSLETDIDLIDTKKEHARVIEKLNTLKDEYREVVLLHYVEGLTIAEVAEILQESENNIRVRLHRALTKLRTQFTV